MDKSTAIYEEGQVCLLPPGFKSWSVPTYSILHALCPLRISVPGVSGLQSQEWFCLK